MVTQMYVYCELFRLYALQQAHLRQTVPATPGLWIGSSAILGDDVVVDRKRFAGDLTTSNCCCDDMSRDSRPATTTAASSDLPRFDSSAGRER